MEPVASTSDKEMWSGTGTVGDWIISGSLLQHTVLTIGPSFRTVEQIYVPKPFVDLSSFVRRTVRTEPSR